MDNKNWLLGTDLELTETHMGADISNTAMGDLKEISEELNLAQAILHRLRTIRGELLTLATQTMDLISTI